MTKRHSNKMVKPSKLREYYLLTKPGIIRGNAITAIAGFLLAAKGHFDLGLFVAMLVGISLVIASGCVFNNYHDREIDKKMNRTKKRGLVTGMVSPSSALVYGSILGVLGLLVLGLFANILTAAIALAGFIFYVLVYTPAKPRSVHATLLGSVAGAVPPVVGYCAVTGRVDVAAVILFVVLVFWQMPHFYAIAMYRYYDYFGAGLPVLPVKKGMRYTKIAIILYIMGFFIACSLLFAFRYAGYVYLLVMLLTCAAWFLSVMQGFRTKEDAVWGKHAFRMSLIVLLMFSFMISVNHFLF
jgi:protoheme IX farnesyltransferase